jgi:hypothetical protein
VSVSVSVSVPGAAWLWAQSRVLGLLVFALPAWRPQLRVDPQEFGLRLRLARVKLES